MNAIPPTSFLPSDAAPVNDPGTSSSGATANSAARSGDGQDFAAALTNAGPKPSRKAATNKAAAGDASGGQLPVPGNPSPPPAQPASSSTASAGSSVKGVTAKGAQMQGADAGSSAKAAPPSPGAAGAPGAADAPDAAAEPATGAVASQGSGIGANSDAGPGADVAQILGLAAAQLDAGTPTAVPPSSAPSAAPHIAQIDPAAAAQTDAMQAAALNADTALSLPASQDVPPGQDATAAPDTAAAQAPITGSASILSAATSAAAQSSMSRPGSAAADKSRSADKPATPGISAAKTAKTATTDGDGNGNPAVTVNSDSASGGDGIKIDAAFRDNAAIAASFPGAQTSQPTNVSSAPTDPVTPEASGNAAAGGVGGPVLPQPATSADRTAAGAVGAAAASVPKAVAAFSAASTSDKHAAGVGESALPASPAAGDGAAAAAQLNVGATPAADAAAPTLKVTAGVESPEFAQGLADRVSWMTSNNLNGAKLQVNPAQLGPIEVRIAVQGDHAQVWLTSHSALTRDALESSSPKLREMLGAQGFGQVSVDISQRSFQDRPAYAQPYDWSSAGNGGSVPAAVQTASTASRVSSGVLDAYA